MTSLAGYSMFTWLPKILTEAGATPAFGGTMLALYSALGLAGALSIPALAVRVANPFPLVLACAACHFAGFAGLLWAPMAAPLLWVPRSEEHTSELQSLMRLSYAVFCLKKKTTNTDEPQHIT